MGWKINLDKNTVKITSEIALALYNCGADVCSAWAHECSFPMMPGLEGIIYGGKLVFNPDHLEHMDYLWDPKVQEVLMRFKVEGIVGFSSNQGDNKGQKWSYHFDGAGGLTKHYLRGQRMVAQDLSRRAKKGGQLEKKPKRASKLDVVRETVASEGFDYAFRQHSSFADVKDAEFQRLRQAYVEAAEALEKYIGPIPET
jgi:hypothetical protein